jgi:hypothetical protein
MKVTYKKTIREKILEEINNARKNKLEIDYIILNKSEFNELSAYFGQYSDFACFGKIYGHNFKVEDDA